MDQTRQSNNTAQKGTKSLTLYAVSGQFTRADGSEVNYNYYYVEILGIKVKVQASDSTGKQLLESYFKQEPKDGQQ